jgi:hypothetical protein
MTLHAVLHQSTLCGNATDLSYIAVHKAHITTINGNFDIRASVILFGYGVSHATKVTHAKI